MAFSKEFRARWAPLARIAYASIADLVADWYYYASIKNDTNEAIAKYEIYLFVFFIVSAIMCGVTLLAVLIAGFFPDSQISTKKKLVLATEMLVGDVPQIVLTALITYEQGLLTPEGAFNFATSTYNIVLDALESCGDVQKDESEEREPLSTPNPGVDQEEDLEEVVVE